MKGTIHRKVKQGTVISNKMSHTVVVSVSRRLRHPKYGKVITQSKKYYAHDDTNALEVGQTVSIIETRPLSKLKRWRVTETQPQS
jgi:small subunit ribosomal protein S17